MDCSSHLSATMHNAYQS